MVFKQLANPTLSDPLCLPQDKDPFRPSSLDTLVEVSKKLKKGKKEHSMAKSWTIPNRSANESRAALEKHLSSSQLPSSARLDWVGNDLQVTIEKAGKSQFTLSLQESGGSTVIKESRRSLALMHKPFVGRVESFIDELVNKVIKES
jgi:hypothetical protein